MMLQSPTGPFRTVRDLLRYGVSIMNEAGAFFGHGIGSAYDEAAYLVLHSLHLPLDTLEPFLDARLLDPSGAHGLHDVALISWAGNDYHAASLIHASPAEATP